MASPPVLLLSKDLIGGQEGTGGDGGDMFFSEGRGHTYGVAGVAANLYSRIKDRKLLKKTKCGL